MGLGRLLAAAGAHSPSGLKIDPAPKDDTGYDNPENNDEMYQTWLYFIMVCVALLVIGNLFCFRLNGRCPWNVYKKRKYAQVKTRAVPS